MDARILAQAVEAVFLTMMNLDVAPGGKTRAPARDQLVSAVHLSGAWNGALLMECGRPQACRFAGRLLAIDPPEAVTAEVRDVLGELANMIGGNIKCAFAAGLQLSMPSVFEDSDGLPRICEGEVQDRLAFDSPDGPFWVTMLVDKGGENDLSSCQQRAFLTDPQRPACR